MYFLAVETRLRAALARRADGFLAVGPQRRGVHFDQRTQQALRDVAGLSTEDLKEVADAVAEATEAEADRIEAFFEGVDAVYSDMDRTHSAEEYPKHAVEYVDLFTHSEDIRGYLRFDTWGVYVEGGRVLNEDVVELTLGPTVNDRVRFAHDRDCLS